MAKLLNQREPVDAEALLRRRGGLFGEDEGTPAEAGRADAKRLTLPERDRPAITPAMIAAGESAYAEWDQADDWSLERLLASVFRAMLAAQGPPSAGS